MTALYETGGGGAATSERGGPIGVVLAGGAGRRLGGAKATAELGGRPLIAWPLAAVRGALGDVVVAAKASTVLPPDLGVPVWIEPDEPRHPIAGLLHALRTAGGRDVLVCAVDLPAVTAATVRRLVDAPGDGAVAAERVAHGPGEGAAVAVGPDGRVQPLLGRYPASAIAALEAAPAGARLTEVVLALRPALVPVPAAELHNVNTPQDLARARIPPSPT